MNTLGMFFIVFSCVGSILYGIGCYEEQKNPFYEVGIHSLLSTTVLFSGIITGIIQSIHSLFF